MKPFRLDALTFNAFINEADMINGAIKITYTFYSEIKKRYYNLICLLAIKETLSDIHICLYL